jgi:hypothetical protein
MNFKLQAKKTPFQRHKEEQELKRKVKWGEKERESECDNCNEEKKLDLNLVLSRFPSQKKKITLTAGRGSRGQGLRGLCRRLWRRRGGP